MKKLLLILALSLPSYAQILSPILQGPPASGATFNSIVQKVSGVYSTTCVFGTTCTITVSSTGSGHLLIIGVTRNGNAAEYLSSVTSGACSGSWQFPAGSEATGTPGIVEYAYCLSSASGVTSITTTWANWQGRQVIEFYEISYTGTAAFVNANMGANTGSPSTSNPGVAFTLSGQTAYVTCQLIADSTSTGPSAINSPYNTDYLAAQSSDATAFAAFSCALNNSSGTAPTWTTANSLSMVSGIAIGVH